MTSDWNGWSVSEALMAEQVLGALAAAARFPRSRAGTTIGEGAPALETRLWTPI